MSHQPDSFRTAAGRFASGVTVVTSQTQAGSYGVTVSSFSPCVRQRLVVDSALPPRVI